MKRALKWILDSRKAVLPLTALITIILLFPLSGLRNDNTIEVWLDRTGQEYVTYREFVKEFQVQDHIIAAIERHDRPAHDTQKLVRAISVKLRKIEGVSSVYHLNDLKVLFPDAERRFTGLFISEDRNVYSFWIRPEPGLSGNIGDVLKNINAVLDDLLPQTYSYYLAGPPVLNNALDEASNNQSRIFFPIVIGLSAAALLLLFRDLKVLLICFTVAGVSQIWSLALIKITGNTMNMVMTTLPPLLWVLSLSALIYMVHALKTEGDIEKAILKIFKPCSLSVATTAFAFLSLALSHVGPVREMGIFTFSGMFISLLLSFTLAPAMLAGMDWNSSERRAGYSSHRASSIISSIAKYKAAVLFCAASITAASIFFVPGISMDTNNLNFFKTDSKVYRDYISIGQKLTGHSPLEIVLDLPEGMLFEEAVDMYNGLKKDLTSLAGVKNIVTPSTFYALHDPDADKYVNADFSRFRISVLTDYIGTNDTRGLISEIRGVIDRSLEALYPQVKYNITGVVPLLVQMQDELLWTQIKSFSLAFIFIAVMFYVLFKSLPFAAMAMIPNIFPVAVNLGLMSMLHIPLNIATIMIASVAIGIAVDDSIHFIVRYRDYYQESTNFRASVANTLRDVAKPVIFTSIVNSIGFGVLMFSGFMPIKYFGMLMVITLASALLADLVLLPALILGGAKWMHG